MKKLIIGIFSLIIIAILAWQGFSFLKHKEIKLQQAVVEKEIRIAEKTVENEKTTPKALEILKRYNAKATFFVMGQSAVGHTDILQRMHAEGHEIGNHTWDHPNLTKLPAEKIKEEIHKTNDLIMKATGQKPVYLRPPYGATNATVKTVTGLKEMLWSVDTEDWKNHNTQAMMTNIKKQLRPGGVILMHDIHQTTIDALPTIMDYLTTQGYYFVTVGELYSTP
ncbi:polysaccharide deacetylase family protein [Streptococcus agalactiae]|uniref:polysaccharide deacetylase family protein n=1 Tax=Streptococcus agalactiae TaxID=1311 RepID=UPI0024B9B560|nr:polysaccharide deacetylase family protein [Streptococcus agalactiae]